MVKIKRLTITTAGEDAGEELSYVANGMQNVQKTHWQYLINSHVSYHPAILASGDLPKRLESRISKRYLYTHLHNSQ